ncbi:hypothetical protein F443_11415 [Phytophthora nicotianae P1569]|uniref:Uncharacterized protein n=1 Tax=Phytophthora nicotianae P1569 TaxID=1317065 RepID=V9EY92_PHYNI|nr:hypothetical protein F443_11415 [Phytophthora nicotianae P1569]
MNPESDECDAAFAAKNPRRKKVFQRRLHGQLSESRMLEVLDRQLQSSGHSTGSNNQEEDNNGQQSDEEEELVCVSRMVKVAEPALSRSSEFQAGGVLKTVRYIHRQRATKPVKHENQAGH